MLLIFIYQDHATRNVRLYLENTVFKLQLDRTCTEVPEVAMALHSSIPAVKYPSSDLCHDVTALCYKLWQADWDQRTGNKLHSVKPNLRYCSVSSLSRGDAVVLQRLRIGHT